MRVGGLEVPLAAARGLALDLADQAIDDLRIVLACKEVLPGGEQSGRRPSDDRDRRGAERRRVLFPRTLRRGQRLLDPRQKRPQGRPRGRCLRRDPGRREPRQDLEGLL